MDINSILSIIAISISVGGAILGIFNHKRIRSKCNNKELTASVDIENTTPLISVS